MPQPFIFRSEECLLQSLHSWSFEGFFKKYITVFCTSLNSWLFLTLLFSQSSLHLFHFYFIKNQLFSPWTPYSSFTIFLRFWDLCPLSLKHLSVAVQTAFRQLYFIHTFEFFPLCLLQRFLLPNKLGPRSSVSTFKLSSLRCPLHDFHLFSVISGKVLISWWVSSPNTKAESMCLDALSFPPRKSRKIHLLHLPFPNQSGETVTFLRWLGCSLLNLPILLQQCELSS